MQSIYEILFVLEKDIYKFVMMMVATEIVVKSRKMKQKVSRTTGIAQCRIGKISEKKQ